MRRENNEKPAISMPEPEWRARAGAHRERVRALLEPGFLVKRERGSAGLIPLEARPIRLECVRRAGQRGRDRQVEARGVVIRADVACERVWIERQRNRVVSISEVCGERNEP